MDLSDLCLTEADRIEWKRSPQDSEGILRSACALANDLGATGRPGYLIVGLEKDGTLRGVDPGQLDRVQQDLANRLRSTKIQPTPSFDISVRAAEKDSFLILVTVTPTPYHQS